jgi:hypothetical protein
MPLLLSFQNLSLHGNKDHHLNQFTCSDSMVLSVSANSQIVSFTINLKESFSVYLFLSIFLQ